MADDSVFAFAGLWESWVATDGDPVETCTILTTTPNALVADVHRRMPAILKRNDYELWLDPSLKNSSLVSRCLEPFDADEEISGQHTRQSPGKRRPRVRTRNYCLSHSNAVLILELQVRNPAAQLSPLFHNSFHRYFVFTPRIALTSIKQLFSLSLVDG
jgi:hypothetical protein